METQQRRQTMASEVQSKALPTIWEIPDVLWSIISGILGQAYPRKTVGRSRACFRKILNGIIYRMRTGAHWNMLPKEFGDDSTMHRWFQQWCRDELMVKIWSVLASECSELGGVHWEWQAADGRMGKARFGGDKIGRNPTDRGKPGTKISILTDRMGGPLGVVAAGANVHDTKLLADTLAAVILERPQPTPENPQHLCLDKGYDNPTGHHAAAERNYTTHIRRIGEEKLDEATNKTYPARRWVVERTLAWLSKCRAILIRYDRNWQNYLGLIQLACSLFWFRRLCALKGF
jgi:putative transposase